MRSTWPRSGIRKAISLACAAFQLAPRRLVRDRVWVFSDLANLYLPVRPRVGTCLVVSLSYEFLDGLSICRSHSQSAWRGK